MKNIFKLFAGDVRAITRHFFAFVIIIAITIIPALYAWFNIYANWDPYGNTGNVSIAIASDDVGYDDRNLSQEAIKEITASKSINWVVLDSGDAARQGVRSGEYYAGIVFADDFSQRMLDINYALKNSGAAMSFIENMKKNPVANKIVETAAETVQHSVQVQYLDELFKTVLKDAQQVADETDPESKVESVISQLETLRDSLRQTGTAIDSFTAKSDNINNLLNGVGETTGTIGSLIENGQSGVSQVQQSIDSAANALDVLEKGLDGKLNEINAQLKELSSALKRLAENQKLIETAEKWDAMLEQAETAAGKLHDQLLALRDALPETSATTYVRSTLDGLILRTEQIQSQLKMLKTGTPVSDAAAIIDSCSDIVSTMDGLLVDTLRPAVKAMVASMQTLLKSMSPVLDSLSVTIDGIAPVLSATGDTVKDIAAVLNRLKVVTDKGADALDEALAKIDKLKGDERIDALIKLLGGDTESYAEFLAAPVTVVETAVYPVGSYGTAMTPFYSCLAIWVGCVILVAIIKVEAEPKGLSYVTEGQKYWSRWLLFAIISQLQAAVIVFGDVYLLDCSCDNLLAFWGAGAFTSLVFITLIYSLTLAFGDIGKAIVVVIMVVQIAGSSGSYPIELLPDVFGNIYVFFPFPYAINAMREALCGFYGMDYWLYIGELLIFGVVGVLVGRMVRKPFIKVNDFVEHELEETEVL